MTALLLVVLKAVILAAVVLSIVAGYLLFFRKVLGYFSYRLGPVVVGPWGTFQPIADIFKMILKEDLVPQNADKLVYRLAPIIALTTGLGIWAVIPWAPRGEWSSMTDPNAGVLVLLAIASMSVYGIALGGWASQNKFGLLGSMRSTAQMISYELAQAMSLLGVILAAGSLNVHDIVEAQRGLIFLVPQFVGFVIFFISALAEAGHTPFDLPEGEAELVGGYHTDYAGMRFGIFFLTELLHHVNAAVLTTTFYLGGYNPWFGLSIIPGPVWFLFKVCLIIFVLYWIKCSFPRFRYDRLMVFGWKFLLPVAALNLLGTAIYLALWG